MEIVYYWLEECEGIYPQGFHLTPEIKVSMEVTDLNVWMGIRKVIESINDNAIAA